MRDSQLGPLYCRTHMYAGCIACCPLLSHGAHAAGTDERTDRRTDGGLTVTLRFPLDATIGRVRDETKYGTLHWNCFVTRTVLLNSCQNCTSYACTNVLVTLTVYFTANRLSRSLSLVM